MIGLLFVYEVEVLCVGLVNSLYVLYVGMEMLFTIFMLLLGYYTFSYCALSL